MSGQMTMLDLFAGIGGFSLAAERVGIETIAHCEIDRAAQRALRHHWPTTPLHADVTTLTAADLPGGADIVTFGSPCQDLSVAGRRAGMAGERSGLFFEAVRIIHELRPAFALWENVPGALSSNHGRDFAAVLDALADAGAVDIAWRVLDAQWFGVPQRRRRIFLVADFRAERAGQILFEPEGGARHPAPGGEAGEDVAGTVTASPPSRRNGGSYPLSGQFAIAHALTSEGADASEDGTGRGVPLVPAARPDDASPILEPPGAPLGFDWQSGGDVRLNVTSDGSPSLQANQTPAVVYDAQAVSLRGREGGATAELGGEASAALRASQGGGDKPHVLVGMPSDHAVHTTGYQGDRISHEGGVWTTLPAQNANNGGGAGGLLLHQMAVRRLTPVECLRLQGFPDDWLDVAPPLSDSAKYRLIGNSVAVPVVEWIMRRLREAMA